MTQEQTYRVLLIDDQEAIHEDYRKVLGIGAQTSAAVGKAAAELFDDESALSVDWEGFELDSAFQGQDGFELVQKSINEGRHYALAFVDIRMPPGWDGIQTVRRIWEVDPEILIVVCSAYSDYSWEEMVRQLGRNDRFLILKKPFDNVEVRQCAMALTERWGISRTDVLTGLLNRRAFDGYLKLEWSRALRHELPLSCAMVDLDYFKRINDTFGHHVGDRLLKATAEQLRTLCRVSDQLCRYGGDELCVLLPHTDEKGAAQWAEHARLAIAAAPLMIGGQVVSVTASIGTSERIDGSDSMEQLIDRADQALLVAKKMGRNRVIRFSSMNGSDDSTREDLRYRVNLFEGLTAKEVMTSPVASLCANATAGEAAEFFLRMQVNSAPIVDSDGKMIGMISEKEVVAVLFSRGALKTPVDQIMQPKVICFEEYDLAQPICEFLDRAALDRIVIVRDGRPTGIVSRRSLLRWYCNRITTQIKADGAGSKVETIGARLRLIQGIQAVARSAAELSDSVSTQTDDVASSVIEGVAQLQELIDDLLSRSRFSVLNITSDAAFPQMSALLDGQAASVG